MTYQELSALYPNLEVTMWAFIHGWLEPWIWYVKDGCAFICLVFSFVLPFNRLNWSIRIFRFWTMVGMATIFYSWGNTSFGPIGDLVFWTGFTGYLGAQVLLLWPAIRAEMRRLPPAPEKVIFNYLSRNQTRPPT